MKFRDILFGNEWITPFLKKHRGGLVIAILLGTLTMLCASLLMFSAGYVISKSATKPENILMIYVPVLMVRIFGIARPLVRYIERLTSHNWILKISSQLRKKLYEKLEKNAVYLIDRVRLGDLLGILNEDIGNVQDLFLRTLFPLLIAGTLSIAIILTAGVFSIAFALGLAIFFGLFIILVPLISYRRTLKYDEGLKKYRNDLFSHLTDDVLGLQDWVLSGRKREFLQSYQASEEGARQVQKNLLTFTRKRNLVLQAMYTLLVLFLLFWASGNLKNGDAPNYIAAVALAIFPLFDAFSPLSDAIVETKRYGDSVQRLEDLPEVEGSKRTEIINDVDISIRDVQFAFEDKKIFDGLSLNIPKGQHLALLGRSGVGKSTLASLVRGDLQAQSGQLTIGGTQPYLAKNVEKKIGIINQNPYIFNTNIRSNLTLGNLEATDEQIWSALDRVGLKEMIHALPEGVMEIVDEAGMRFSGGERQRLALARILLSDVDIVILDEPTVSLDPITENQVLNLFFEHLREKTVLFITHHLLGVHHMERVIFLAERKIKFDGAPNELLENNATFQKLYHMDQGK